MARFGFVTAPSLRLWLKYVVGRFCGRDQHPVPLSAFPLRRLQPLTASKMPPLSGAKIVSVRVPEAQMPLGEVASTLDAVRRVFPGSMPSCTWLASGSLVFRWETGIDEGSILDRLHQVPGMVTTEAELDDARAWNSDIYGGPR